jgi:hypothetical protein
LAGESHIEEPDRANPKDAIEEGMCVGYARKIEPDMQIREVDITQDAASRAEERLKTLMAQGPADGDNEWAMLNSRKIAAGYALRRQALEDVSKLGASSEQAMASSKAFCTWLIEEGFWYD